MWRHAPATRRRGGRRLAAAALLLAGCAPPEAGAPSTHASYRQAAELVEAAAATAGTPAAIAAAGGLRFRAEGVQNRGAEHQGSGAADLDPGPFAESLVLDPAGRRVAYEYRHDRSDGTFEWIRHLYEPAERQTIGVLQAAPPFAVLLDSPEHPAAARRLARRFPQQLLAEVLEGRGALRRLGERDGLEAAAGVLADGRGVTLLFEPAGGRLRRVELLDDVQGFGDAEIAWEYDDWREVAPGLELPHRYGVTVAGRPLTEMTVTEAAAGDDVETAFTLAEGVERRGPFPVPAGSDPSAGAAVEEVADGLWVVRDLRGGFHPLAVELDDFVVAFDAPAGYRLLQELPPGEVAAGPSAAWLSERYLELLAEAVPDKPVTKVVLTHFHNDHAGGVRAFVAAGATVLAAPADAAAVERLVAAPHTLEPDRLALDPRPLRLEIVDGPTTITDGRRRLEILPVGPNPHSGEMLVGWLPEERLLFVSDLLDAAPLERFPAPHRAELDRFFAGWLAERGLEPERILTMHGAEVVTAEHLAKLRRGE